MTSEVSICNMALSRIRVNQRISALTDQNDRARLCSLWYEPCRDEILSQFPWAFATRTVALATVAGDPPPGWGYAYRYPTDCIRARALSTEEGVRRSLSAPVFEQSIVFWREFLPQPVPFQIMGDSAGRVIVTDLDEAVLWYTSKVTDPNQFDALFVSLLAWRMAPELAMGLDADDAAIQRAQQGFAFAVTQAEAADLNEQKPDKPRDSDFVTVR